MQLKTIRRYQVRAENFYRKHCQSDNPTDEQICSALEKQAEAYRPNAFTTLKSALITDQQLRGNPQTAKAIRNMSNPVTAPGSTLPRKSKPKRERTVSEEDYKTIVDRLKVGERKDELAALILASYLGARPCEMRTISITGNTISIIGAKKRETDDRGADRMLSIRSEKILLKVRWAIRRLSKCPRSNSAIADRLRLECREQWPRRKKHPTLYSFRHQLGANLKASGESAETIAYIMGHQSTESISVYGDSRTGQGRKIYIAPAEGADFSNIRSPRTPPRFGRERIIGSIQLPIAAKANFYEKEMTKRATQQSTPHIN